MFKENTLLVVGAGASEEFKLPIGSQLSKIISTDSRFEFDDFGRLSKGKRNSYNWLQRKYPDIEKLNEKLRVLREISDRIFLASSIDNFIDMHSKEPYVAELGKFQIAISIAEREKQSNLYFDLNTSSPKLDLERVGGTWIDSFARILIEKTPRESIDNIGQNVSIICFNYDRCIEYYLIEAIRQAYIGVEYTEAHKIVSRMNIIHPYGALGQLPTKVYGSGNDVVPFGGSVGIEIDPWPVAARLKTYTEQIEDKVTLDGIRSAVKDAKQIVFLGFAFHPQNMELMTIKPEIPDKRIYSTGRGISKQEVGELKRRIYSLYAGKPKGSYWDDRIIIEDNSTCAELFGFHWRNLSVA